MLKLEIVEIMITSYKNKTELCLLNYQQGREDDLVLARLDPALCEIQWQLMRDIHNRCLV